MSSITVNVSWGSSASKMLYLLQGKENSFSIGGRDIFKGCCPPWSGASGLYSPSQIMGSPEGFPSLRAQCLHLLGKAVTLVWSSYLEPLT